MKYAKPEITALTAAICAIQSVGSKSIPEHEDGAQRTLQPTSCYEDNE